MSNTTTIFVAEPSTRVYNAMATVAAGTKQNTSSTYADLMLEGGDGTGITVPDPGGSGGLCHVLFTCTFLCSAQCRADVLLYVDGVALAGASTYTANTFGTPVVHSLTASGAVHIAAGSTHAIKVRWAANSGTISIDPNSINIGNAPYHASLTVTIAP
jgi:hypothetical protein